MNRNKKNRKSMNKKRVVAGVATVTALTAALAITAIAAPMDGGQGFSQNAQPQFGQEMQAPEGLPARHHPEERKSVL